SPGTPSMARARPPRNGPICRQCIPEKSFGSICGVGMGDPAGVGDGAAYTAPASPAKRKAKKKRRPREFMTRKFQTYVQASTANRARLLKGRASSRPTFCSERSREFADLYGVWVRRSLVDSNAVSPRRPTIHDRAEHSRAPCRSLFAVS